jgi:hypothetical protein
MAIGLITAIKFVGSAVITGCALLARAVAGAVLSALGFTASGVASGESPREAYLIHRYPLDLNASISECQILMLLHGSLRGGVPKPGEFSASCKPLGQRWVVRPVVVSPLGRHL